MKSFLLLFILSVNLSSVYNQSIPINKAKGNLFIIGGGNRSESLMKKMLLVAKMKTTDYIVVLPMSSAEPDSSFYYLQQDLRPICNYPIINFNFTKQKVNDQQWLDSLLKAKLIFITGGDQNRFMEIVLHTPIHNTLIRAYVNGCTIAGTSAGAAVMSRQMITGKEITGDSTGAGSFKKIRYGMVDIQEGLGLISTAIIDQHFIARSRYNRLLSVLADNPATQCIGIDEQTAVIVQGNKLTITGESQVIRFTLPPNSMRSNAKNKPVGLRNIRMDIFVEGEQFILPN